jgi:UDP:flavonoid glycosyltransferase YjiC (YdhE family)
MARFLLAMWPYTGHVYPNIALAHALQARGHEVAFYTGAMARPVIEREGFRYFPFRQVARQIARVISYPGPEDGAEWDLPPLYQYLSERYTVTLDHRVLTYNRVLRSMYHDWFLGTVPAQVADLQAILAEWSPHAVVCDPFLWGPILVLHEAQGVPVAVFSFFASCLLPGREVPMLALGFPRPRSRWIRWVIRALRILKDLLFADVKRGADAIRRSYGLPPLPAPVMEYAGRMPLYLIASAPEFDYQRGDLPPSAHYIGPCLWDKPAHEPPPAWLGQLNGTAPVVYVTEGTAQTRAPILLQAACQGLVGSSLQVIMTTGRQRDPAQLGLRLTAPNVRVERWVPHSDLLPKVSVAVTHGGSGTVLSALCAGLPLVIVPMQWDQLENAQRVVEAGAGVRLRAEHCTPERLRAAVTRVLEEPSFRHNARRLATALNRYEGPRRAAELLEQELVHP